MADLNDDDGGGSGDGGVIITRPSSPLSLQALPCRIHPTIHRSHLFLSNFLYFFFLFLHPPPPPHLFESIVTIITMKTRNDEEREGKRLLSVFNSLEPSSPLAPATSNSARGKGGVGLGDDVRNVAIKKRGGDFFCSFLSSGCEKHHFLFVGENVGLRIFIIVMAFD